MSNKKKGEPTQLDRIESMLILLCEQSLEEDGDPLATLDDPIDTLDDTPHATLD